MKLCRNVNRTQQSSKKSRNHPSSRLSLTTAGSSINRALGAVSAGGIGTPELDVTQSGGVPSAFVASQPGGNSGGVKVSKFLALCRWEPAARTLNRCWASGGKDIDSVPMTIFRRSQFAFTLANRTRGANDSRCQCNYGTCPDCKRRGSPHYPMISFHTKAVCLKHSRTAILFIGQEICPIKSVLVYVITNRRSSRRRRRAVARPRRQRNKALGDINVVDASAFTGDAAVTSHPPAQYNGSASRKTHCGVDKSARIASPCLPASQRIATATVDRAIITA